VSVPTLSELIAAHHSVDAERARWEAAAAGRQRRHTDNWRRPVGVRMVWLIVGALMIPACASLPPERIALRATLDKAASECRTTFPVIIRYEIDSFDRLVYYYREDVRYEDRERFLDCVRDRVRDAGITLSPPPGPTGSGTGTSAAALVYPNDLRIIAPTASVAPERAAFSGHWTGQWEPGQRAHALVVEQIDESGAIAVYAGRGSQGPFWNRNRVQFVGGTLRFTSGSAIVTYQFQPDGTLFATLESQGTILRSRMTRLP
jgi:hypothetical protein